jgi:hypothetical protein
MHRVQFDWDIKAKIHSYHITHYSKHNQGSKGSRTPKAKQKAA